MKISFFLIACSFFGHFWSTEGQAQILGNSGGGWSIRGTDPIEILYDGKQVTNYESGYDAGKPYFYPIIGPTGENMTRHWPMNEDFADEARDHVHHRGLWYGLGNVNGFDFWHPAGDETQKDRAFGVIVHRGLNGVSIKGQTLTLRTKSDWVQAANREKRVCSDRREFTLFYREDGSLVIDLTLTLLADAGEVIIVDDKDGAWAIRPLPTLRLKGKVAKGHCVNSERITDAEVSGNRASWVDVSGPDRAGNPVGIAMLDHPTNPRYPAWWIAEDSGFFAANPFGQGKLEKDALETAGQYTIPNGESVTFRYRTIFHSGDTSAAKIAEAFEAFSAKGSKEGKE